MSDVPETLTGRIAVDAVGCWNWLGATDAAGYGRWSTAGRKSQLAHRVVFGHEYTPQNTYLNSRGHRNCRTCMRRNSAARRSRNAR